MMRVTIKDAWILAILVVFGMIQGGRAEAGIVLTGGVTQGGDPQYTYYIDVYLENDTIPAYPGSGPPVATVSGTGITGLSSVDTYNYSSPYGIPPVLVAPTVGTDAFTVKFFNTESITAAGMSLLLQLVITTPQSATGLSPGDQFNYSFTIGAQSGGGVVTLTDGPPAIVPEPSSLVLMLAGGTVLSYVGLRHRRRRRSVVAA